jgi:hypothetical protein
MAFVSFRDDVVGHEFTTTRLRHSLLEIRPLLVTQNVDARAASFDFRAASSSSAKSSSGQLTTRSISLLVIGVIVAIYSDRSAVAIFLGIAEGRRSCRRALVPLAWWFCATFACIPDHTVGPVAR